MEQVNNMVKVVIIGGGFGGLNVARSLAGTHFNILLLDRMNHHVFQPLLYQVATAALSIGNIASPLREILRGQPNVEVIMANVERMDKVEQKVYTTDGEIFAYDFLVVATGSRHSYFGNDQWETFAPGLKTIADAERIREKILMAFEQAERSENPEHAQQFLNFVIVGAGPTGVEMAGSIAEFAHRTLFKNFHHINPAKSKIYLIEGANQVLPSYPPPLAQKALKDLAELGVEVLLNTMVTNVTAEGVYIGDRLIAASNVIWAAGNQASSMLKSLDTPLDKQARVIVNKDLTIPHHSNVFVIGDAAFCLNGQGLPLAGIAPVAIQQARYVSNVIDKNIPSDQRKPFVYFDKGTIATIGNGKAVGMVRKFQFSGFFAWFIWGFVHIFYLISFRYRLLVLIQWIFLYMSGKRQERVITQPIDAKEN
jgi:NADH:ubiquinone reductase (H+-translocating)